ncbi:response regulator transcription factor [Amycolatopsis rubida]|uniref:Regulatory protein, luxR family n=1 Tax=Amycolatopsis rubida TaxID=112413 RepID=A0A1I5VDP1_9PSEU|nr:LuxR C-terminal-related transcriptional regulator [Amycolatopsis rubida]SFQ05096.1 regulatory protein, luxR family [Amycolatopsis rubida]
MRASNLDGWGEIEGVISSLRNAVESQQAAIDKLQHLHSLFPAPVPVAKSEFSGNPAAPPEVRESASFTKRQAEVLDLLARGASNRRIGRALGIKEQTVKAHVHAVFLKLGATHRTEAVSLAYRLGILSTGDGSGWQAARSDIA